jgi:hypothetical protein
MTERLHIQRQVSGSSSTSDQTQVEPLSDHELETLAHMAELQSNREIAAERVRLGNLKNHVGLTIQKARGVFVGYAVYLPLVLHGR